MDRLIPECVHGNHNMDGAGVLVFKSCSRRGFKDCQDPSGLKLEQVRSVIKSLAEFHAVARSFVVKHGVKGVERRYPILGQVLKLQSNLHEFQSVLLEFQSVLLDFQSNLH